jgi:hypothetical protein
MSWGGAKGLRRKEGIKSMNESNNSKFEARIKSFDESNN